jgi:hypothetical protein
VGKFQFLFSINDWFASVGGAIVNIMVVDTQMMLGAGILPNACKK